MSLYAEKKLKIAIDGPAGAGKSSVAREVARRLRLTYLDTGAMYRAITLKIYREKVALDDPERLQEVLEHTDLEIRHTAQGNVILLDGEDVTAEIRRPYINCLVSQVAAISAVRQKMVALQQEIARRSAGIIMEGRDIASRVIPDAGHKIYLEASLEERARRRWQEQLARGEQVSLEEVRRDIARRDRIDSSRRDSPLTRVPGVTVIDTTNLNLDEVVEKVIRSIKGDG